MNVCKNYTSQLESASAPDKDPQGQRRRVWNVWETAKLTLHPDVGKTPAADLELSQ